MSSPRDEKRDGRDSRGDEREGRKRKMKESEEAEEIKHSPSTYTCCKDSRPCPTVSQYQLDAPVTHFTSLSAVCKSYQDGEKVIMKGSLQRSTVQS